MRKQLQSLGLPSLAKGAKQDASVAAYAFLVEKLYIFESAQKGCISQEELGEIIRNSSHNLTLALRVMMQPNTKGAAVRRRSKQLTPFEAQQLNVLAETH